MNKNLFLHICKINKIINVNKYKIMVERIKQIMEYYHLSPIAFAEMLGINRSNLTHLFSGRNQPSLELAKKILQNFPEIKTEWLIMGVGQIFRDEKEKEQVLKNQNENKFSRDQNDTDLFSPVVSKKESGSTTAQETHNQGGNTITQQIFDSKGDIEISRSESDISISPKNENTTPLSNSESQVTKIVFFYSDGRFEMYKADVKS